MNRVRVFVSTIIMTAALLGAPSARAEEGGGSNRPADFGSGYTSWGTRGGATLGGQNGANVMLHGGGAGGGISGYGLGGIEGHYFLSLGQKTDLGIGGRLPFWPFGVAPGVKLRHGFISGQKFQLALDISAYVPIYFTGYFVGPAASGIVLGLSIEPGVMMSYFFKDNMELYFGAFVPVGMRFIGGGFGLGLSPFGRVGFTYTFKKQNLGVYGGFDVGPVIYFSGGAFGFYAAGHAGVQFRL